MVLTTGYFPFRGRSYPDLYRKICHGIFTIPDNLSRPARDLIRSLLQLDPRRRLTAAAALKHPWMANCIMPDNRKLREECTFLISEEPTNDLHDDVLNDLASYGVSVNAAKDCVTQKKHNGMATLYYLLLLSHSMLPVGGNSEKLPNVTVATPRSTSSENMVSGHPTRIPLTSATKQANEKRPHRFHRPRSAGLRYA